jgi:FkbM family methyltransferase
VYLSPFNKQNNAFKKRIGSSTNFECDLNENSVVFDVGGYEGNWTSDVYSMYNCKIYIFEPVPDFADKIKKRFARNKNIFVNGFGLSDKTQTAEIALSSDSSSTINKNSEKKAQISLVDVMEFINQNKIPKIDLIKINIEGGEYALLNRLIDSDYIKNIDNILVQFHDFFPGAKAEMEKIRNSLAATHEPVYQYEFVWEFWKRKQK